MVQNSVIAAVLYMLSAPTELPSVERNVAVGTNSVSVKATDWPWWRGTHRNGFAAPNQSPPTDWSESNNIAWVTPLPGRGHSSPTVIGDRVCLLTADEENESQMVLCFDRSTGKRLWKTEVNRGNFDFKGHKKTSQASSTIACDGERFFAQIMNNGGVHLHCLDLDGNKMWVKRVANFVSHQGFGASPAIYNSLVIASADNKGGGAIAAFDRVNGELIWKRERPSLPNYTSPIILNVAGRHQLILTGCDLVSSFDPKTGETLWETKGATTECVTSAVTDGTRVFSSGGYPNNHMQAIRGDGTAKIEWENNVRVYVPSMLVDAGYLYSVTDAGVVICWDSETGNQRWKARLGGTFNASMVLVGDLIYASNQSGTTFIFKANPSRFELVAKNKLGEEVYASPVICNDQLFLRVAKFRNEKRSEFLYCIAKKEN